MLLEVHSLSRLLRDEFYRRMNNKTKVKKKQLREEEKRRRATSDEREREEGEERGKEKNNKILIWYLKIKCITFSNLLLIPRPLSHSAWSACALKEARKLRL